MANESTHGKVGAANPARRLSRRKARGLAVATGLALVAGLLATSPFSYADSSTVASAGSTITSQAVTLRNGQVVPTNPDKRTADQEAAYRDQINRLDAAGDLTPQVMSAMGLRQITAPTTGVSAAAPPVEPANIKQADAVTSSLTCSSIRDEGTSASAITVSTPRITMNASSQNYILYATGKYQWSGSEMPYSSCAKPVPVGGIDGFAIALNRSSTNLGLSFTGCTWLNGSCRSTGYLETNSSYGGGWALQDYAGNLNNAYGPTFSGTLTYGFRLSSLSGCTQAFTKYAHTWDETAVNGFGVGPWSISVQWTKGSSQWQKSSQAGKYGSC